ncbi:hypothetical protein B0J12DRAFT_556165, partial [Macrophomina phaseolina]
LSRMTKREFWSLFYPAFEAAFTQANIESGFAKTGLHPLNPEAVLQHLRKHKAPRPPSSTNPIQLSPSDLRKLKRTTRLGVEAAIATSLVPKLLDCWESAETRIQLLEHELAGMNKTVSLEKRRRKRGQALLSNLFEMTQGESIFISPKKIIKAREQLEQKEHEKEQ